MEVMKNVLASLFFIFCGTVACVFGAIMIMIWPLHLIRIVKCH